MSYPIVMTGRLTHTSLVTGVIWRALLLCTAIAQISGNTVIFPDELPQCGRTSAKFGGGNQVKAQTIKSGDFPWLAAVGQLKNQQTVNGYIIQRRHFSALCGGTLITNRHVLSAAHCFLHPSVISPPNHVRLGEHHLRRDGDGAQYFLIVEKRSNNYNKVTNSNDIIILKLDRDVTFNGQISPACLPSQLLEQEYAQKRLTVVGWGMTTQSKLNSLVPMREEPEHVPLRECQQLYRNIDPSQPITKNHICAGRGKADSCMGDSGGPLNFQSGRGSN
ncbi:unnamed protein product [Meganyctiphanes norvegica]|uniref:Peptidase S1 domain-containing protein n=1 Tax=Meganyctiphanes norvegica TaxID=48144 RepID=A0AAV2S4P0_MEGNR